MSQSYERLKERIRALTLLKRQGILLEEAGIATMPSFS